MKHRAYFITGTNTGVGKTFVTAAIISALKKSGVDVGVMKTVESGCAVAAGRLVPTDAIVLKWVAGVKDPLDVVNPYRFRLPLAPHVAARGEGVDIDFEHIKECLDKLKESHEVVLVEGFGGLHAPVKEDKTCADLVGFLGIPIIIVAHNELGVINPTLLTIEVARGRGIEVTGVILNNPCLPRSADVSLSSNSGEIERFGKVKVFGNFPFHNIAPVEIEKGAPVDGDAFYRALEKAGDTLDLTCL